MRHFNGIPANSQNRIIGKITKRGTMDNKNCIIVTESIEKRLKGYKAILTPIEIKGDIRQITKLPIIYGVKGLEAVREGDIVSLDMLSGDFEIVYEKDSIHNSIVAHTDCNCRCIMCPQCLSEYSSDILWNNLKMIRLIDQEIMALGITGGEPTLLGDGLLILLRECKKRLPRTQIQILTNGILFKNTEYVRKIARVGINNLVFCIPLYADTDVEHDSIMQREGAFEDVIQGLYNLAINKQLIEIRIVVMSLNFKRLLQIAEFIYHNFPFVVHVAFMGMEVEGRARKNAKKLWVDPEEYACYLRDAVLFLNQRRMEVSIYNEQFCLLPRDIWTFISKSISEWKNIYLEECSGCSQRARCGGLFASSIDEHKAKIRRL